MIADVALTYMDFVVERHRIWEQRQAGAPQPWTEDPVLASKKFTNVFRVLDPGSQFALKLVDDAPTPRDALARALLYRFTNRPQVWEWHYALDRWPLADDMDEDLADLWCRWRDEGGQVFSGAYIIMPRPGVKGVDKVREVIRLVRETVDACWLDFALAETVEERYRALRRPSIGAFMAMQALTDYGYSRHGQQDENEFCVCGPGAIAGARAIAPSWPAEKVLEWAWDHWQTSNEAPRLAGRRPSYMDTQNTLCEFSKYVRFAGRPSPARPYNPAHPGPQPAPVLPSHWK